MTKVTYNDEALTLSANGHSGFLVNGVDILCCACSSLMYTLRDALDDENILHYDSDFSGYYSVTIGDIDENLKDKVRIMMGVIRSGFKSLAFQYPDYISYKEV